MMMMMANSRTVVGAFLIICICGVQHGMCTRSSEKYLAHLFNKYGSRGVITFEGLEHLMHNLGLGGLEFDHHHTIHQHRPEGYKFDEVIILEENRITKIEPNEESVQKGDVSQHSKETATIHASPQHGSSNYWKDELLQEINFKEMHDPMHKHIKDSHDHHGSHPTENCLSPKAMIGVVMDPPTYTYSTISQHRHERSVPLGEEGAAALDKVNITSSQFLELCPVLLVQLDQAACSSRYLGHSDVTINQNSWLFASVSVLIISLCGLAGILIVPLAKSIAYDDILQFLIALAIGTLCGDALMHLLPHALEESDSNLSIYLCACTFGSTLVMYLLETLLPLFRSDAHSHHHGHHHNHGHSISEAASDLQQSQAVEEVELKATESSNALAKPEEAPLTPVAFMVIIGDGLHNITDGLAIGAAFAVDPVTGMATAFAVLCHELPHELGDFALLLKTGVSLRRAIILNGVSSVLSFIGMGIGLLVAGMHGDFVKWIYAGTAGSFLYIALADLMPTMGMEKRSLKMALVQGFGVLAGGVIMLIIAINEHRLTILFE